MSTSTVITFAADSSVATFFLKTKNLKDFCSPAGHPPSLITELDCRNVVILPLSTSTNSKDLNTSSKTVTDVSAHSWRQRQKQTKAI